MKIQKIIPVLILIGFVFTGRSQSVGIKAGPGLSKLSGPNYDHVLSFHGGFFYVKNLSDRFHIQPELLLSWKGSNSNITIDNVELSFEYMSVSLPILVGLETNTGFILRVGPALHYLVSGSTIFNGVRNNSKAPFASTDFSVDAAIGYKFGKKFGIEFRYEHGFQTQAEVHFTDINGSSLGFNEGGKDRSIQFSLFYLMPLKKI